MTGAGWKCEETLIVPRNQVAVDVDVDEAPGYRRADVEEQRRGAEYRVVGCSSECDFLVRRDRRQVRERLRADERGAGAARRGKEADDRGGIVLGRAVHVARVAAAELAEGVVRRGDAEARNGAGLLAAGAPERDVSGRTDRHLEAGEKQHPAPVVEREIFRLEGLRHDARLDR